MRMQPRVCRIPRPDVAYLVLMTAMTMSQQVAVNRTALHLLLDGVGSAGAVDKSKMQAMVQQKRQTSSYATQSA